MIIATTNIDEVAGTHSYNFYVRDYLGSVRAVVGANGELWQFKDYHVTGIPSSQFGQLNADDHLHTGKEYNAFNGLHMYDNNARSQDPILGRFTTLDPLAEKYPNFSPYAHCANNPLKYIDPTGKIIVYAPDCSEEYIANVNSVRQNLTQNGLDQNLSNLENDENIILTIGPKLNTKDGTNFFDKNYNFLAFDPTMGAEVGNNNVVSPTVIFAHELDHADQYYHNNGQFEKDRKTPDSDYKTAEEKRVITGTEQKVARALNEISATDVTRTNHNANPVRTLSPTSNFKINPNFGAITLPKKEDIKLNFNK